MRYVIVTWRKNIHHTYLYTPYWSLLHTVKNSCLYFLRWTWLGDLFSCISWLKFFYLWFLIEYGKIFSCPRELFFFYAWAAPNEEFKCNVIREPFCFLASLTSLPRRSYTCHRPFVRILPASLGFAKKTTEAGECHGYSDAIVYEKLRL